MSELDIAVMRYKEQKKALKDKELILQALRRRIAVTEQNMRRQIQERIRK